ncbi:NIPSNAP family protein [Dictyobacter aurantiacus]|uniref:NIPSNAP family containing protein n=1 Tax=Dictyobacter aurantiacus TaxID=1936993 RepID=A0A401ZMK6_9CHLR|nr:NIPSNAP family protein [Dictyobacter aurantiacus]GCE08095.1 NIPSNAP family containing protein [Dictyobacter aurantiacus]
MSDDTAQASECCSIIELRRYTLKPGRRDELIALFEEHFIEGQERYGMRIIGLFRDLNRPNQFVWLRGFADMESRRQALEGFYYGPIWQAHRTAANDTMIDSDNVLLLRPAPPTSSFQVDLADRPAPDAPEVTGGFIVATLYALDAQVAPHFVDFFAREVAPVVQEAGAHILGQFITETSENTFPALPVREGEYFFVWLASFADEVAYQEYRSALASNLAWTTSLVPALHGRATGPEEVLELHPARRSRLRHHQRPAE